MASPAEKGKANDELIAIVANIAEVPRREVSILRGAATRNKVLRIASAQAAAVAQRIILGIESAKQR